MHSSDEYLLYTPGIGISNDRNQKDIALVRDNLFSGMS